ncbi:flagellar biosynthetic protein FliO [Ruficoccus amylovorans]|uniref:Flagellar biosynthetic protein FliO n=1 Tax=Ruficoccus amylovorans TaxID=1804625 RepID=A0A842HG61_9BACT|nr:flagellar biosynthetic protein FliO [Ruficoccus amylovorans]MBC2595018.1 flagellar biosynthetic protein FliO [Ruficoccus amylovorans]
MFLGLILIGALAIWLFKRRGSMLTRPGQLKLLESRSLGGRQFIVVAAYGNERFLLGVCPGRIDYLGTLQSPEDVEPSETIPPTGRLYGEEHR